MTDTRCEDLIRISNATFQRFMPFRQLNQDLAENCYPARADFTTELNYSDFAGTLMDGSPVNARETLGNAIDAMLRQGEWFKVGTGDKDRDQRPANSVSLNRATNRLRSVIKHRNSMWDQATKEADHDWVAFGANDISVEKDWETGATVFRVWHLRDCAWIVGENGRVHTHFRNLNMSARDIMRRINQGNWTGTVAQAIRDAALREPEKEFKVRHILMRSDELYGGSAGDLRRVRHPYISIYLDLENMTYLNERGSPVFNHVVSRYRTLTGKPWAFSPHSLNSIQDARMLQDMALVILEQGQKAVDPPTIGASTVFTRDIDLFAGGHTQVDLEEDRKLGDVFTTVETGNIAVGLELKQDVRALIAEAWLLNKLMLPTLRDMREVEVMVRTEEFRRAALPFFKPIDTSYHGELLGVTYDLEVATGGLKPDMFTEELRGHGVEFTFESPLNEAEGKEIVDKYYGAMNIIAAGAQVDKTVATIFDIRKATEEALSRGTKPEWLVPEEKRKQLDQDAEQMGGLAQAADIARQASGVAADVSNATIAAQQAGLAPAPGA